MIRGYFLLTVFNDLDELQRQIVENTNENILLIAGPGSGKTRVLVHKIANALEKNSNKKIGCLGLTFTSEAAKKMKEELEKLVSANNLRGTFLGNYHQFGQYLLRKYGHHLGISRNFRVIDEEQSLSVLSETVDRLGINGYTKKKLHDQIYRFRGNAKMPKEEDLSGTPEEFVRIVQEFEKDRRSQNLLDFDDLISLPIKLLRNNLPLKKHIQYLFQYVFVDELQDTSFLQLEFLKLICDPKNNLIFGVADEDQILYEWRDARVETIEDFRKFFNATEKWLVYNYRSPQLILDVADSLIKNNQVRHDRSLISKVKDSKGFVYMHKTDDPTEEARYVATNIQKSIESGNQNASHAIFLRDAWMMKDIKKSLYEQQIPFVHIGDRSFQKKPLTRFTKMAISIASGFNEPFERTFEYFKGLKNEYHIIPFYEKELHDLIDYLAKKPISHFVRDLYTKIGITKDFGADSDSDEHIILRIIEYAIVQGATSYTVLNDMLTMEWNRLQDQVLMSENKVKLMTIHQAKGQEFPVVYIMHMEDSYIPRIRKNSTFNLPEERRLLFVAITRAMKKVLMTYSRSEKMQMEPSRFLKEIPASLIIYI